MKKIMKIVITFVITSCMLMCGCKYSNGSHAGDMTDYNYKVCKKVIDTTDKYLKADLSATEAMEIIEDYKKSMEKGSASDSHAEVMVFGIYTDIFLMKSGSKTSDDVKEDRDELSKYIGYK